MTPTTRTAYDAKLDAIERIERQVRRYDGAQAANLIVYGEVPIKELAWTEMEPEEIASAAMGGVTNEYRPRPPAQLLIVHDEWEDNFGDRLFFSIDGLRYGWYGESNRDHWDIRDMSPAVRMRPLGRTWSQIESLAGGEGRR